MHYTYIIYSKKFDKKYFGSSSNIKQRLAQHNSGQVKATAPFKPYKLLWCGIFKTKELAQNFEKYLKSSSGHAFTNKRLL